MSTSCMLNFSQQEMSLGLTSPAGSAPGGSWSGSSPLFSLVPSYFSSASQGCLTFVPSNPTPIPPTKLGNGWDLPAQDLG